MHHAYDDELGRRKAGLFFWRAQNASYVALVAPRMGVAGSEWRTTPRGLTARLPGLVFLTFRVAALLADV
jgi:hypothetical protein